MFSGEAIQSFWRALPMASTSDGFLQLSEAYFMGDAKLGSQVLQRVCYVSLLRRIKELREEKYCRFLITGGTHATSR